MEIERTYKRNLISLHSRKCYWSVFVVPLFVWCSIVCSFACLLACVRVYIRYMCVSSFQLQLLVAFYSIIQADNGFFFSNSSVTCCSILQTSTQYIKLLQLDSSSPTIMHSHKITTQVRTIFKAAIFDVHVLFSLHPTLFLVSKQGIGRFLVEKAQCAISNDFFLWIAKSLNSRTFRD